MSVPSSSAELVVRAATAPDADVADLAIGELRALAARLSADRTYLTVFHADGTLEVTHEWSAGRTAPHRPFVQRLRQTAFPYSHALAHSCQVLNVGDLDGAPAAAAAERASFASFGVRGVLQFPITAQGRVVGVLGGNRLVAGPDWSDHEVNEIEALAPAFGIIADRFRAARELDDATNARRRAMSATSELLANVSHELRTPLHAMLGYAELLEMADASDEDRAALDQIQVNGRRLTNLVDELVSLATPAGADMIDVAETIGWCVDEIEPVARERGIAVTTGSGNDPVKLLSALPLRQAIYGALSRAVDALPDGGRIEIDTTNSAGVSVRLSLWSPEPVAAASFETPIAALLLAGGGAGIDVVADDDPQRASVVVRLGQPARP